MDNKGNNSKNITNMSGIYVIYNISYPDMVKVGYSNDIQRRIRELQTAAPAPFRLYCYYECNNELDMQIHRMLDCLCPNLRVRINSFERERVTEFYKISKETAHILLQTIATVSGTFKRLHQIEEMEDPLDEEEARMINDISYDINVYKSDKDEEVLALYDNFIDKIKQICPNCREMCRCLGYRYKGR